MVYHHVRQLRCIMKLIFGVCVAWVVLMGCVVANAPTPAQTLVPKAIFVDNPIVPPDVPMVNQDGRPATLSDFRGRYVFVTFSNIDCQETCVDALPLFQQVKRSLGERADVIYVMVGTDFVADSPAALKVYLARYDPSFIGLTALRANMSALAVRFGIHSYERKDGALAPHAPFTYLLDKQGRLVFFFQSGLTAQQIVDAAKRVMKT